MTPFASAAPATRAGARVLGGLLLLVFLVVVVAVVALLGLGRFSGDIDPTRVPGWFWHYRHDPFVRRWLLVGLASAGLLGLPFAVALLLGRRRPLHGAARWATPGEQRRAGLRARSGVVLGRCGGELLIADGPEHVMLYAPTRTGKGVGVVIPNLLAWPGSVVVLDIKRENFAATAGFRAHAGQRVLLFDPLAPDGRTARFNPLGHIDRTDPITVVDELQRIAAMLFPMPDHADPFWSEAARTGFIGVGGLVAGSPDRPFTIGEILRTLTTGDSRTGLPRLLAERRRSGDPLPSPVEAALADFTNASENTFASVRQTLTSRLGLWLNPRVDRATSASDFDLAALRDGGLSLYLCASPENMLRIQPLYALLFQQLCDLTSRRLPRPGDRPVLVLLDEFARLGPAPVLAHAFAWAAGYGLRLLPVLQSPSQLRAIYGPDLTEDILTNCGLEIVFAPKELRVAQELSERLGALTAPGVSRSRPAGLSPGRRSVSISDQRRPLMLPQELMQLDPDRLIVLKAGLPPVPGRKIVYYRERAFRRRLLPAPEIPPAPFMPPPSEPDAEDAPSAAEVAAISRAFAAEGLAPPAAGASEAEIGAWLDRVVDRTLERAP